MSRKRHAQRVKLPPMARIARLAQAELTRAVAELVESFVGGTTAADKKRANRRSPLKTFDVQRQRLCFVAEALTHWHANDAYLCNDGMPRPLPRAGKLSLTTLARHIVRSTSKARSLVDDLFEFGLVEEAPGGYLPARRSAVLGKASVLNLAYATTTASRLLRTISHNISNDPPRLFERQVSDVTIREADLPVYLRFVEEQAQYLIDSADDWLSRRRIDHASPDAGVKVGLGAFAWAEFSPRMAPKRGA